MNTQLDKVINELKNLSTEVYPNIELPTDTVLASYEREIGFIFPEDYKKVLKEVSNIFYGTIELASITNHKEYYRELSVVLSDARKQGLPKNWLPICEDNGSYYCLVPSNEIRYWTTDGYSNDIWPNLAEWIKQVWIEGN